jgi:hypothetical protein
VGTGQIVDGLASDKTHPVIALRVVLLATLLALAACSNSAARDDAVQPSQVLPSSTITAPEAGGPATEATPRARDDVDPGLSWLLRGNEHVLTGWEHNGAGAFVPTGNGVRTRGGIGLLWYSARPFRDFELRLQWRASSADDNSGVFVRFPPPRDPSVVVPGGLEIQIYGGTTGEPQKTGALYDVQRERRRNSNAPGEWNDFVIRVVGDRVTVVLNGLMVNAYEAPSGTLPEAGHVGLQNHGPDDVVSFRRVRIREFGTGATPPPA